jgi:hypothetical protein
LSRNLAAIRDQRSTLWIGNFYQNPLDHTNDAIASGEYGGARAVLASAHRILGRAALIAIPAIEA